MSATGSFCDKLRAYVGSASPAAMVEMTDAIAADRIGAGLPPQMLSDAEMAARLRQAADTLDAGDRARFVESLDPVYREIQSWRRAAAIIAKAAE